MALREDIKPITYLKNNAAELIGDVAESGRSVVITQNGTAKVVMMSVDVYDRWRKATALIKLLSHSEAAVSRRETVPQHVALERAEAALRRATGDDQAE
ncbi:MAG: type II toxin-antitoxin system Phd/YefM family antitoxin [bacterium]